MTLTDQERRELAEAKHRALEDRLSCEQCGSKCLYIKDPTPTSLGHAQCKKCGHRYVFADLSGGPDPLPPPPKETPK